MRKEEWTATALSVVLTETTEGGLELRGRGVKLGKEVQLFEELHGDDDGWGVEELMQLVEL